MKKTFQQHMLTDISLKISQKILIKMEKFFLNVLFHAYYYMLTNAFDGGPDEP